MFNLKKSLVHKPQLLLSLFLIENFHITEIILTNSIKIMSNNTRVSYINCVLSSDVS